MQNEECRMKKLKTREAYLKNSAFCILHSAFLPAFTLVELMIVMIVIIILMAMLFPAVIGQRDKAKRRQAQAEVYNLYRALEDYKMTFGMWPNQTQAINDTTYFTNNWRAILPLLGNNSRGKVCLRIQSSNQFDSISNYLDPWGVPYVIAFNENMDTNILICISNISYYSAYSVPPVMNYFTATNCVATNGVDFYYSVGYMDVAVASFGVSPATPFATNIVATFSIESWSVMK
jgi:type II secretory pathway pseudopilin PulG